MGKTISLERSIQNFYYYGPTLHESIASIANYKVVWQQHLLVDPGEHGWLVLNQLLLLEPQGNFLLGRLNRVRAVAHVSTHVNGVVTSDGAWSRSQWVGGTQDGSTLLDNILTFPDGGQHWTRQHVGQQGWEERLGLQVVVVLSQERLRWLAELDAHQLEASVLESAQDLVDQASLDTVGLNGNEGSLVGHDE